MKIKTEDKVIGLPSANLHYMVTRFGYIASVTSISPMDIYIKSPHGRSYGVDPKYFVIFSEDLDLANFENVRRVDNG